MLTNRIKKTYFNLPNMIITCKIGKKLKTTTTIFEISSCWVLSYNFLYICSPHQAMLTAGKLL